MRFIARLVVVSLLAICVPFQATLAAANAPCEAPDQHHPHDSKSLEQPCCAAVAIAAPGTAIVCPSNRGKVAPSAVIVRATACPGILDRPPRRSSDR